MSHLNAQTPFAPSYLVIFAFFAIFSCITGFYNCNAPQHASHIYTEYQKVKQIYWSQKRHISTFTYRISTIKQKVK